MLSDLSNYISKSLSGETLFCCLNSLLLISLCNYYSLKSSPNDYISKLYYIVAFLSGHLSILEEFLLLPIVALVKSKGTEPAGILPVADFNNVTIEAYTKFR